MKKFKKEITKNKVKVVLGGLVLAAVGTIAGAIIINKKDQNLIEGIDFQQIDELEEPIELDSYREEA